MATETELAIAHAPGTRFWTKDFQGQWIIWEVDEGGTPRLAEADLPFDPPVESNRFRWSWPTQVLRTVTGILGLLALPLIYLSLAQSNQVAREILSWGAPVVVVLGLVSAYFWHRDLRRPFES